MISFPRPRKLRDGPSVQTLMPNAGGDVPAGSVRTAVRSRRKHGSLAHAPATPTIPSLTAMPLHGPGEGLRPAECSECPPCPPPSALRTLATHPPVRHAPVPRLRSACRTRAKPTSFAASLRLFAASTLRWVSVDLTLFCTVLMYFCSHRASTGVGAAGIGTRSQVATKKKKTDLQGSGGGAAAHASGCVVRARSVDMGVTTRVPVVPGARRGEPELRRRATHARGGGGSSTHLDGLALVLVLQAEGLVLDHLRRQGGGETERGW